MVSADNLNLDVLEMIFSNLSVKSDLAAVALVSRSFLSAVIPKLYSTLSFRLQHAKKYHGSMSPFAALLGHPQFAVHTRNVEIHAAPKLKTTLHPTFLRDCAHALAMCQNLTTFTCTVNALPPLLQSLQNKDRLTELRVHAGLSTEQAEKLTAITKLTSLSLDSASWNMMDILTKWAISLKRTLTSLSLYMSSELNELVLESVLESLPGLTALHVIGCQRIDHICILRVVKHTPLLESLSFTTWETTRSIPEPAAPLHHLRHLALDARFNQSPSPTPTVLAGILTHLREASLNPKQGLVEFIFRMTDRQVLIGLPFIQQLLQSHANTLKRMAFVNCTLGVDAVGTISRKCRKLEQLEMSVPVKELHSFSIALANSSSIHTLVDMADTHVNHGPQMAMNSDHVKVLMRSVKGLQTVMSNTRVWTAPDLKADNKTNGVTLRRQAQRPQGEVHWFEPRVLEDTIV